MQTNRPGKLLGSFLDTGGQVQRALGANPVLPPLADGLQTPANALPVRYAGAGFSFLDKTVHFSSFGAIDWNFAEHGKLWTYNLNYFEYLRQPGLDPDVGEQLIGAWITEDTTHLDGWEPYPISLRLVNWLQFYRSCDRPIPVRVLTSIRRQYAALWRKREYHLGGNHLLENAIALSMTARCLADRKGQQRADRLLLAELKEQYLPDGAHFELSVMYHLILLWRQLDLYSFLAKDDPLRPILGTTLKSQLSWANYIITADGRFPHFNDSTNGIAPDWAAVQAYAEALQLPSETSDKQTPSSGLIRREITLAASPSPPTPCGSQKTNGPKDQTPYGSQKTTEPKDQISLWIDAAQIGPTYIPGHAHADNLTFVLDYNGQPIIVDPSISTYEKNKRRAWERSTVAHNTVLVNGQNSSDVWGGFRVGKRAKTYVYKDTESTLVAEHDGYGETSHYRTFNYHVDRLEVIDELSGATLTGVARLHFSPGLVPEVSKDNLIVSGLQFTFAGAANIELFNYQCAQGFNQLADGVGVKVEFSGKLTTSIQRAPDL